MRKFFLFTLAGCAFLNLSVARAEQIEMWCSIVAEQGEMASEFRFGPPTGLILDLEKRTIHVDKGRVSLGHGEGTILAEANGFILAAIVDPKTASLTAIRIDKGSGVFSIFDLSSVSDNFFAEGFCSRPFGEMSDSAKE